jgi:hypothetical protein
MTFIPKRYLPKILSKKDYKKQKSNILKSRKLYKKGIYYTRPKVSSFHSKPSNHIQNAQRIYKMKKISPNRELSQKTGCSQSALEKIVNKGRGAYFSSGSRPNQSGESWGIARLASSVTGGKASIVDFGILHNGCKPGSKALNLAKKTCKKFGKCKNYTSKKQN